MERMVLVLVGAATLVLVAAGAALAGGGGHGGGLCDGFRVGGELRLLDSCFDGTAHFTEAGGTLTVRNEGETAHTITAADGSFDSGMIDPGDTFELELDEPGVIEVFCRPHGAADGTGMAGVLVVGDPTPESLGASHVADDLRRTLLADLDELVEAIDGQAATAQDIRSRIAALSRDLDEVKGALGVTVDDPQGLGEDGATVLGAVSGSDGFRPAGIGLLGLAVGIAVSSLYVGRRALLSRTPPGDRD